MTFLVKDVMDTAISDGSCIYGSKSAMQDFFLFHPIAAHLALVFMVMMTVVVVMVVVPMFLLVPRMFLLLLLVPVVSLCAVVRVKDQRVGGVGTANLQYELQWFVCS